MGPWPSRHWSSLVEHDTHEFIRETTITKNDLIVRYIESAQHRKASSFGDIHQSEVKLQAVTEPWNLYVVFHGLTIILSNICN
jgi:hypothetical protein